MGQKSSRTYLFAGVVILALGGGYYMFNFNASPVPNGPTSNLGDVTDVGNAYDKWVRKTDAANLYSAEILADWKITDIKIIKEEGTVSSRLWNSLMGAESPDWQTENRNDFDAPTHIKSGASVEFYVSNTPIDYNASNLGMPLKPTSTKREIIIDGVKGEFTVYREDDPPHHEEGLVLETPVEHGGNFFTFRFAYNPTTYPQGEQVFMDMLNSIRFTK